MDYGTENAEIDLRERTEADAGISSLRLTVAALPKVQELVGVEPTARDQVVVDTMSKLARQAFALTAEALAVITATACQSRVGRRCRLELHARRRGLVDVALCRVLSDAGLRRFEAAALTWDDGSGRLPVRRSKGDAEERTVYLTPAAVFGLSAPSISRRIRDAAASAGLGSGFSGHSGRVGMARRMAAAGAPTHEIMA